MDHVHKPNDHHMPTGTHKNACLIKHTPHALCIIQDSSFPMSSAGSGLGGIGVSQVCPAIWLFHCTFITTIIMIVIRVREIWLQLFLLQFDFVGKRVDIVMLKKIVTLKHASIPDHPTPSHSHAFERVVPIQNEHAGPGRLLFILNLGKVTSACQSRWIFKINVPCRSKVDICAPAANLGCLVLMPP